MVRLKINVKGIEREKKRLRGISQTITKETPNVLREVGNIGRQFAINIAPEWTGALKQAILDFPLNQHTWLIVSGQPAGDLIPTHILFETGAYPNARDAGSLFFMTQTSQFLEQEFARKLNLMVTKTIEMK